VVVAISAWKGSGKDTIANYLIEQYDASRTAFADPLKDLAAEEYGFPRSWADDPKYKESPLMNLPVDPRDKFTTMLTDFMRREFRDQNGKAQIDGNLESVMYWTPRALCILKGSTNRAVDPSFWVKQAIRSIQEKNSNGQKLHVITDLRYRSELVQLKEAFGNQLITLRVNRFATSPSEDPSERDLDNEKFDYTIDNTSSVEFMLKQVQSMYHDYWLR